MGAPMRQVARRFTWSASSPQELADRAPNITLLDGSRGRIELTAQRVLGVCPVPLSLVINTPLVGSTLANHLAPTGAVVTDRGAIGLCDAFIEWTIPVPAGIAQQGMARMGFVVALVVVIAAIGAALVALGWVLTTIKAIIDAIVEAIGPVLTGLGIAAIVGVGLIAVGSIMRRR